MGHGEHVGVVELKYHVSVWIFLFTPTYKIARKDFSYCNTLIKGMWAGTLIPLAGPVYVLLHSPDTVSHGMCIVRNASFLIPERTTWLLTYMLSNSQLNRIFIFQVLLGCCLDKVSIIISYWHICWLDLTEPKSYKVVRTAGLEWDEKQGRPLMEAL